MIKSLEIPELLCIAFRGGAGSAPENSFSSIKNALSVGARHIHLDVVEVDGELVLYSGKDLCELTDGHGEIRSQTFDYVRSLSLGCDEVIPTLSEALDLIGRKAVVHLGVRDEATAIATLALLDTYVSLYGCDYRDWVFSSNCENSLIRAYRYSPNLRLATDCCCNTRKTIELSQKVNAHAIHPHLRCLTDELLDCAQESQLKVYPCGIGASSEVERMRFLGVDGVMAYYPELLLM
jgi:glycerophosphoryl diester phosphodiesterase